MAVIDCTDKTTREINREIERLIAAGELELHLRHPGARHNLAVGILAPVKIVIEGSAGYYCGGMIDGPTIEIQGSAGWGAAECMMSGRVIVRVQWANSERGGLRTVTVQATSLDEVCRIIMRTFRRAPVSGSPTAARSSSSAT